MHPVGHEAREPGQGGGDALGEVMGRHGGEAPPSRAHARQLDHPAGKHHPGIGFSKHTNKQHTYFYY